jgi:hypothetical protein
VAEPGLARFGSRYTTRPAAEAADPDRATWDALDAGRDPTAADRAGPAADRGAPADRGRTDGGAADRDV